MIPRAIGRPIVGSRRIGTWLIRSMATLIEILTTTAFIGLPNKLQHRYARHLFRFTCLNLTSLRRSKTLDGIRGIAVCAVVGHNLGWKWLRSGWYG